MLQKVIKLKTLKEVKIMLKYLDNNDIEAIDGENITVRKLIIHWINYKSDEIILYNLQKKFPNLTDIEIYTQFYDNSGNIHNNNDQRLEIKMDPDCQIKKFKYSETYIKKNKDSTNKGITTKFLIQSYENLEQIIFGCIENSLKLEKTLPIFSENCNYIFKSLTKFEINTGKNFYLSF